MTNRREFLKIGIASSSLPLAAASVRANTIGGFFTDADESIPYYKVVADDRYPESMAFAEEMDRRGYDTYILKGGDLTDFWINDLSKIWKTMPVAVAGVTNFRPVFCLEQLGRTYGTRVIYRGDHANEDNGSVTHSVRGPAEMVAKCQQYIDFKSTANAGRSLADMIVSCEAGTQEIVEASFSEYTAHDRPRSDAFAKPMVTNYAGVSESIMIDRAHEQALVSWIVAPVMNS